MTLIYFVITIGVLIFVHEMGHFIVAKMANVKVEKFSLGFGPKLFGRRMGETEYLISAFPLGGYVKMLGEGGFIEGGETHHEPEPPGGEAVTAQQGELTEEEKRRSFAHKPPLVRMVIVLAGPVFNLVFAWVVFIALSMMGVPTVTTKIGEVLKDKPAWRAGILKDDVVMSVDGKAVYHWDEFASIIIESKGRPLALVVKRAGQQVPIRVTPEARVSRNLFGERVNDFAIGVATAREVVIEHYPPIQAIAKGTSQTLAVIELTVMSLVKMAQRIVPLDTVGGPIMIAKMAGEQASAGGASFLAFVALISVNLGVLNLLPVPVLDGGHLIFYLWEVLFRRPLRREVREYAQQIGLVLLLGLMALAFYNDIVRYFVGQG